MTKHPLADVKIELELIVSAMCSHLRYKAFTSEENERGGMIMLIESQMMVDELGRQIHCHELLKTALQKHQAGEPHDEFADCEGHYPTTIYQYCLDFFEGGECPLGTSTEMLTNWVASYVERHQALTQLFEKHVGDELEINVPMGQGAPFLRPANAAEKFDIKTTMYLRLVEQSNVLSDYNERMLRIRSLLQSEATVSEILALL